MYSHPLVGNDNPILERRTTVLLLLLLLLLLLCHIQATPPPPTMGCYSMLTVNTNLLTNALRGDLLTVNLRPWCGHHTCSVHQWIGNWILPQFDPRMSFLAVLGAEMHLPLYITGNNCVDCFFTNGGVWCGCCWFSFMHSCGGIDDGYDCAILKHKVGIAWLPKMAHSAPPP